MTKTESGTLFLRKPGRMMWKYSSPQGKIFLLDGKYAWFYTQGDAQVQRIPSSELDDLRSPLRFLLGHTQLEKELTGLTLAAAPNGCFTLTGVPKGQEKRVTRVALTVTRDGTINGIEVDEADGAITQFTFTTSSRMRKSRQRPFALLRRRACRSWTRCRRCKEAGEPGTRKKELRKPKGRFSGFRSSSIVAGRVAKRAGHATAAVRKLAHRLLQQESS